LARAAGASVPNTAAQLHKIVMALLAGTPTYFRSLRSGVKTTGAEEIDFKNAAAFSKICPGCTIADEYATANTDERFAVTGNWPMPLSATLAQKAAFVAKNFAALVKGYAYTHGKNSDGELWFDWTKGTPTTFLYLETYHSKSNSGIEVRVGHYLAVSANFVKWARLTADQKTDLTSGVEQLVTAGTLAGANNFSTLRGAATDKNNNYFKVNQTFGTVLTECDVDGIFADEASSGGTGKWILECQTPDLGGTKAANLELIRSAVVTALPGGFTPTTDPKYLGTDDYRWDRSSDSVSVNIWSDDNGDGTILYHVQIFHYLN
jgi:hypothetical protein